jgi:hypothetical protein
VTFELGLKGPLQNLLDKASKRCGWALVPELSTYSGGQRVGQADPEGCQPQGLNQELAGESACPTFSPEWPASGRLAS